ncbi:T9SS type A sorting domain-containing protein [Pseudochryseolinea flava]|nr:T9SS type A sorting domain-containing protein [Pseudochryseolinea flava]
MKKKLTLFIALALVFINTIYAQERLWGISDGAIFSVNKDGSDYVSTHLLGSGVGTSIIGYAKTTNGIIYVTHDDDSEEGEVGVLNQDGARDFYHHWYLGPRGSEGMTFTHDGKVYMPARSVMSSKIVGLGITDPTGSFVTRHGYSNTSFLSSEPFLTATSDGIFGVSSGTTGNLGGIFKLSSDAKSIQVIHQFVASSPGTRATGKLIEGTDGTLFGETLRGGKNDKGIYFKINKDGSNLIKLFDKADGLLNVPNAQGKYQLLVDFIALGYTPLRDSDGFIFISTPTGVYKLANDGSPLLQVTATAGELLSFIDSPIQHHVKVNNVISGATNVTTHVTLTLDTLQGANSYEIQLSTTADFSGGVQYQRHHVPSFDFSLEGSTTYYVRARPMTWPYFGATVSFTTETRPAQIEERLWGVRDAYGLGYSSVISDKVVFSMRKDGSDYIEHNTWRSEQNNLTSGGYKKLSTGEILTTVAEYNSGDEYVSKITKDGVIKLFDVSYMQAFTLGASMVELGNGRLVGSEAGTGPKFHGVIAFASDGGYYKQTNFSSTKDLAADFYLTSTSNGVYGVSRGDASNKGFVFRVRDDHKGFDIVYQFLGLADGKQPTGRIEAGADNFLFGQTQRGGKNNAGIFFKVKDDGSAFTKLFDRADGEIWKQDVDGKFSRLLDFIAAGYTNITTDSEGFYYLGTPTGIFKIRPDGYPNAIVNNVRFAESLSFVPATFSPNTFVKNIEEGSQGLPTSLTLRTDSFPGTTTYIFELSKSPDFNNVVIKQSSTQNFASVQELDANTLYYSRVRPSAWPYFGKVISFTTAPSTPNNVTSQLALETNANTFYVDKNGSNALELAYAMQDEHDWGGAVQVLQLSTGEILAARGMILSKISQTGLTKLYNLDYDEFYGGQKSWLEKDGYLYYLNFNIIGSELHGVSRLKLDGSQRERYRFTVKDLHRGAGLTGFDTGIYGANDNVGDAPGYIFKLNDDLSGIAVIYTFAQGLKPMGRLLNGGDGFMYGVTRSGGDNNCGIIYRVKPDGTAYQVLHHFTNTTGRGPVVGLLRGSDGLLYGATRIGGASGKGVIFRIHNDGTGYEVLLHLSSVGGQFIEKPLSIDEALNIYGIAGGVGFFKFDVNSRTFSVVSSASYPESITLLRQAFTPDITVTSPADQSSGVQTTATFVVNALPGANHYQVEISESPLFTGTPLVFNSDTTLVNVSGLLPSTTYFARVRTGLTPWFGNVTSFTTSTSEEDGVSETLAAREEILNDQTLSQASVFPNPTSFEFSLTLSADEKAVSIEVSDMNGFIVYKEAMVKKETLSFGRDFKKGVYILKLTTANGVHMSRLIKQ